MRADYYSGRKRAEMEPVEITAGSLAEGDIVEFDYGERRRLAYVLAGSTKKRIAAWDFNKEKFRPFLRSKIRNVRFLEDGEYKILQFDCLPSSLRDPAKIVAGYEGDGYMCYASASEVVAVELKSKPDSLRGYPNSISIYFDINGKTVGLIAKDDRSVTLLVDDMEYKNATIGDLAAVFKKEPGND